MASTQGNVSQLDPWYKITIDSLCEANKDVRLV